MVDPLGDGPRGVVLAIVTFASTDLMALLGMCRYGRCMVKIGRTPWDAPTKKTSARQRYLILFFFSGKVVGEEAVVQVEHKSLPLCKTR